MQREQVNNPDFNVTEFSSIRFKPTAEMRGRLSPRGKP